MNKAGLTEFQEFTGFFYRFFSIHIPTIFTEKHVRFLEISLETMIC